MTPALLTRRSVLPYFSSALVIAFSNDVLSVTSTDSTRTFVKSRGKALILSVRRPKSNIGNPSALNNFAISAPNPELAPVITISGLDILFLLKSIFLIY